MVDYTKGYGYILELEKMADETSKEETLKLLREKFALLNIPLTSKEEFGEQFKNYQENWRNLIG